jgi:superkiller protein 3
MICRDQGQYQEAIAYYRKATEHDPKSAIYYHFLGHTLSLVHDWENAIAAYKKALDIAPTSAIIYQHLGDALSTLQHWEQAATAYRKSVDLEPHSLEAQDHLGFALAQLQRWDDAILAYRRALDVSLSDVVYLHLGDALEQRSHVQPIDKDARNDLEDAVNCYRQALELNPNPEAIDQKLNHALSQLNQASKLRN